MSSKKSSQKKYKLSADSPSLWNFTKSPGWSKEEIIILKAAIAKWGLGAWKKIVTSNCLPGKTPAQLNLQAQRLCGQQSLGDFMGIRLHTDQLLADNQARVGILKRKNGCIVNTGDNPKSQDRKANIAANKEKYGLTKEEIDAVEIPESTVARELEELMDRRRRRGELKEMKRLLALMETRLEQLKSQGVAIPERSETTISPSPLVEDSSKKAQEPIATSVKSTSVETAPESVKKPKTTKPKNAKSKTTKAKKAKETTTKAAVRKAPTRTKASKKTEADLEESANIELEPFTATGVITAADFGGEDFDMENIDKGSESDYETPKKKRKSSSSSKRATAKKAKKD